MEIKIIHFWSCFWYYKFLSRFTFYGTGLGTKPPWGVMTGCAPLHLPAILFPYFPLARKCLGVIRSCCEGKETRSFLKTSLVGAVETPTQENEFDKKHQIQFLTTFMASFVHKVTSTQPRNTPKFRIVSYLKVCYLPKM